MARTPSRKNRPLTDGGEPSVTRDRTLSGLPLEPAYRPPSPRAPDYPGEPPYTRGVYPTMYRGRLWTMRQYAGYGSAAESNRRYKYLLAQGNTGLSVAFDLPTQMGYDSDHPMAKGEVGKVGVAIGSLRDMEALLDGIPLDRVSTSMTINATAMILLALYVAVAEGQGVPLPKLRGTTQNDILKEYIARSTHIYPPGPSMRLAVDLIEHCARRMPGWNPISISGYHIREAGATAAQEVAFTLADAIAYVEAARSRRLAVDEFAPRLSFFFAAQTDVLEEVAKFRAARRMWARIMEERFGAKEPESLALRFHAQTAGAALAAQQPHNNVVRVALQGLAAVLGGAQSLHTNSMDEALGLPSEKAVRLALRTQQILAHESGVANTVDPVGGSYTIEVLTEELESEAEKILGRIDRMGGMRSAIERGWVQREIAESAYRYQREVEERSRLVVGVNAFREADAGAVEILRVPPAVERKQAANVRAVRRNRDSKKAERMLRRLETAARGNDNLFPFVLDAVRAHATLGEISDTMRNVFGVHKARDEV
ncbi:MAG: methylmalonyl-CoA mutase [Methanobacteriota archaeon]|nr:MAG: methylmalonyl-CoA mutase [Euryarchaeota archaeon]